MARRARQGEGELGPCPGELVTSTCPAVRGDDLADDRQAQPGAAAPARAGYRGRTSRRAAAGARRGSPCPCRRRRSGRTRPSTAGPSGGPSRPAAVCWIALTIRLSKTWPIRSRSGQDSGQAASALPCRASRASPRRCSQPRDGLVEQLAGADGSRSSRTRPCSIRVRSSRSLIMARIDRRPAGRPGAARPAWASAGRRPPRAAGGRPSARWSAGSSARG